MPGWAGSSSYFNRYMDPHNTEEFVSKEAVEYWQDVDLYIGGSEHATGHLLYSRFWQKFLFDKGIVPVDEYAKKLINQGMISGTSAFVYKLSPWLIGELFGMETHETILFPPKVLSKNLVNQEINKTFIDEKFENQFLNDLSEGISENSFQKLVEIFGKSSIILNIYESEGVSGVINYLTGKIEFSINPIHADVSLVNLADELDIEAFKKWRPEYKNAEFILEKGKYVCGREVEKMSKSKYNVVNPDQICEEYGADSLRMFEMFLGPLEQSKPWKTSGISGVLSFLKKLWKLYIVDNKFSVSEDNPSKEEFKILHKTIKKVEEDIDHFSFNTSVSTFMIAVNELTALKCNKRAILEPMAILMEPYAPHIAEELWKNLGHTTSVSTVDFPVFEPKYLVESSKEYPVSFNGKMRFKIELPLDLSVKDIEDAVMAHEKTQEQLQGRVPNKVIIVPGKIINIVG